tara:strand:+ start:124 stop:315 length:192 start_codon:yes stop_codon:yes gene_type:complete
MNELIESTDEKDVYETPFGHLEVYKKDKIGQGGFKEGTSVMIPYPDTLPARKIKLAKKYRNQS